MSQLKSAPSSSPAQVKLVRTFPRFSVSQRWEHAVLLICIAILLLTGLPQKYAASAWSQTIISSPERLAMIQDIHHITALVLTALVIYHLGKACYLIARRKLPGDMLPTVQDIKDAWNMMLYLIYIKKQKPAFGKYNFEQKVTYWFLFFSIGIMIISGYVMWPLRQLPVCPGESFLPPSWHIARKRLPPPFSSCYGISTMYISNDLILASFPVGSLKRTCKATTPSNMNN
jgi:formate dehydrogenase gamma subunit